MSTKTPKNFSPAASLAYRRSDLAILVRHGKKTKKIGARICFLDRFVRMIIFMLSLPPHKLSRAKYTTKSAPQMLSRHTHMLSRLTHKLSRLTHKSKSGKSRYRNRRIYQILRILGIHGFCSRIPFTPRICLLGPRAQAFSGEMHH